MDAKREIRSPVPVLDEKRQEIKEIMNYFADNTYDYKCTNEIVLKAIKKTQALWEQDYDILIFENDLCKHYPAKIFIPLHNKSRPLGPPMDLAKLQAHVKKAHVARCRRRFPVPVILFNGNYVCRSSTTAGNLEALGRLTMDMFLGTSDDDKNGNNDSDSLLTKLVNTWSMTDEKGFSQVNAIRKADADLLDFFKVKTVVDLMVEFQKMKYNLPVSSSEKDLNRHGTSHHSHFDIFSTPYPGCEFFTELRPNHYQLRDDLFFNWAHKANDAKLDLPTSFRKSDLLGVDWSEYQKWSLVQLTQNYTKLILSLLEKGTSGVLVHCISGWDRTPLFIAIIRLSLWADGLIHTSLDSHDMVYLTVVYDWMLFGHHWTNRQVKGEDIFFFCYAILTYLGTEDFSISHMQKKREEMNMEATESINRNQHSFVPGSLGVCQDNANGNGFHGPVPLVSITEEHNEQGDASSMSQSPCKMHSRGGGRCGARCQARRARISEGDSQNYSLGARTSPRKYKMAEYKRNKCISGESDVNSFVLVNDAGSLHGGNNSENEVNNLSDTNGYESTLRAQRLYEVRSIFSAMWFGAMGQDGKLIDYGPQAGPQGYIRTISDVANRFGRAMSAAAAAVYDGQSRSQD